jgi:hypothetical protein
VQIDASGLVIASSRVYEDGAQLARTSVVLGIGLVGLSALIRRFGRGDTTRAAYGVPLVFWRTVGWIFLCLTAVGLVMMAVGSG